MNEQTETFSLSPLISLSEKGKWLLAVTSFEANNSVFILYRRNNSFSITIPGFWSIRGCAENDNRLQKLLKLRSERDIKLHVEEVRKRRNQTKMGQKE